MDKTEQQKIKDAAFKEKKSKATNKYKEEDVEEEKEEEDDDGFTTVEDNTKRIKLDKDKRYQN